MDSEMVKGSVVSFHDIEYKVPIRAGCCKSVEKTIIDGVDGMFTPGMNAIMGPTGSGKSSLLDIIAGRKDPVGLAGQLLIDGNPQPKNFKCMTGYVVQDDVVMGTLSVRENFMFSANMRLPSSISYKEKKKRVQDTINELGLTHCADTLVGTEFIRGVSGGERKRTNIGMELIISPSILFLDEPTTGLDASTSYAVLHLLHRIARKGKTIIFSIHQPRYSIFKLFDRLMLLSRGKTVYHGPAEDALEFFNSMGYECEEHNNPADFFLDVVNGDSSAVQSIQLGSPSKTTSKISSNNILSQGNVTFIQVNSHEPIYNGEEVVTIDEQKEQGKKEEHEENSLLEKLSGSYKSSRFHKEMITEAQPIFNSYEERRQNGEEIIVEQGEYQTSFFTQLRYLAKRAILNLVRNPLASVLQILLMIVLAILVGALYYDLDKTVIPGIQNRIGMFFFVVMTQIFVNISALELFIRERAIFIHENSSGFYRVSSFFIAKLTCDLFPMRLLPLLFFAAITYFMCGLNLTAGQFFMYILVLFCVSITSSAVCFCYSAAVGVFIIANLFTALSFVLAMVFGGLLVNIDSLWVGIRWLQYLSIFRYALNGLSINELKGLDFEKSVNGSIILERSGEIYLTDQGVAFDTDWDLWLNVIAILLIGVFYFVMCYIALRRIKKLK